MNVNALLAGCVLIVHLVFILWVIFGAFLTRGRPILAWLHIASLIYAVVIEAGPWACPLTALEDYFRQTGGAPAYRDPFLVHHVEILVYPSVSELLLFWCAVAIAAVNLTVYGMRLRK
jgi:hypothetical protein